MLKRIVLSSIVLSILVTLPLSGKAPNIREGQWEITTKTEMPGMPMAMPAVTHTQCLTKRDMVPQNSQENQGCKISKVKIKGNTVTWKIFCKNQNGTTSGSGKITYKGTTFKGYMTLVMKYPGQEKMKMKSIMSGCRIGNCK